MNKGVTRNCYYLNKEKRVSNKITGKTSIRNRSTRHHRIGNWPSSTVIVRYIRLHETEDHHSQRTKANPSQKQVPNWNNFLLISSQEQKQHFQHHNSQNNTRVSNHLKKNLKNKTLNKKFIFFQFFLKNYNFEIEISKAMHVSNNNNTINPQKSQ